MPIYSEEGLEELRIAEVMARSKYADLFIEYLRVPFQNPLAKEMALQGFSRRLKILLYCIETVFERLPPWSDAVPEELKAAEPGRAVIAAIAL